MLPAIRSILWSSIKESSNARRTTEFMYLPRAGSMGSSSVGSSINSGSRLFASQRPDAFQPTSTLGVLSEEAECESPSDQHQQQPEQQLQQRHRAFPSSPRAEDHEPVRRFKREQGQGVAALFETPLKQLPDEAMPTGIEATLYKKATSGVAPRFPRKETLRKPLPAEDVGYIEDDLEATSGSAHIAHDALAHMQSTSAAAVAKSSCVGASSSHNLSINKDNDDNNSKSASSQTSPRRVMPQPQTIANSSKEDRHSHLYIPVDDAIDTDQLLYTPVHRSGEGALLPSFSKTEESLEVLVTERSVQEEVVQMEALV